MNVAHEVTQNYPILEYDADSKAIISPSLSHRPLPGAERCVICFFREVIDRVANEYRLRVKTVLTTQFADHPVYEIEYRGGPLAFFHPGVGAPLAAALMDEMIAHGYSKFVACGGAGVLDREVQAGKVVIPRAAVRDEGTSYHYVAPAREIEIPPAIIAALETNLKEKGVPFVAAKTWTTDAFFRETEARRDRRRAEGCLTVEMECASFAAVAQHRNVLFGQYLYGGDNISGPEWDERGWRTHSVRESLFWLAADACLAL
ncbi:MAG: nucleoside phosphorylase [Spirochaetales bacterium]|nr:nucleoside phosphorylase [Spirochaetales bacterium]